MNNAVLANYRKVLLVKLFDELATKLALTSAYAFDEVLENVDVVVLVSVYDEADYRNVLMEFFDALATDCFDFSVTNFFETLMTDCSGVLVKLKYVYASDGEVLEKIDAVASAYDALETDFYDVLGTDFCYASVMEIDYLQVIF